MNKLAYLQSNYLQDLLQIDPATPPQFGKMNLLQMVEHMSYAFRQASGLIPLAPVNDEATTQKMYAFMMSDKPFRDNTPNPYLPDEPAAPSHVSAQEAVETLRADIATFVHTFEADPERRILNPFFGNLNQAEWIHLLHKHALHHLRQFGLNPTTL